MLEAQSMNHRWLFLPLSAALALLAGSPVLAVDKTAALQSAASQAKAGPPKAAARRVDINSASRAELKALPGIGDAEADRIIAARPYPSKAKLVADKVLSEQAYGALKGRIVAGQKATPKTKADGKAPTKP